MKDLNTIGAEVYAVISKVSKERQNKIPTNVFETFKKYQNNSHNITIVPDVEFEKQNISKEAKDIIFAIAFNYWLTPEEKKSVTEKLRKNEEANNKIYDPEKLFKSFSEQKAVNNDNIESNNNSRNNTSMVKTKEKWYRVLINKIKRIFKRKK